MKSMLVKTFGAMTMLALVLGTSCRGDSDRKVIVGIAETVDNLASRWADYYVLQEARGQADASLEAKDKKFWTAHRHYQIVMAKTEQAWNAYETARGTVQELTVKQTLKDQLGALGTTSDALAALLVELMQ